MPEAEYLRKFFDELPSQVEEELKKAYSALDKEYMLRSFGDFHPEIRDEIPAAQDFYVELIVNMLVKCMMGSIEVICEEWRTTRIPSEETLNAMSDEAFGEFIDPFLKELEMHILSRKDELADRLMNGDWTWAQE